MARSVTLWPENEGIVVVPRLGRSLPHLAHWKLATSTNLQTCLYQHAHGDWGTVCAEDKALNDQALIDSSRVLSAYAIDLTKPNKGYGNNCLWIITESDDLPATVGIGEHAKPVEAVKPILSLIFKMTENICFPTPQCSCQNCFEMTSKKIRETLS
jgi:hypothetical protein